MGKKNRAKRAARDDGKRKRKKRKSWRRAMDLVTRQSALALQAMDALVEYLDTGRPEISFTVRGIEKDADDLKRLSMLELRILDIPPAWRRDLLRSIDTVDQIANYAKTTVRFLDILGVRPDTRMAEIAQLIREGTVALDSGYRLTIRDPAGAMEAAAVAAKAERSAKKIYRKALVDLLAPDRLESAAGTEPARDTVAVQFADALKLREIYRHMSNAADSLATAATTLREVTIKQR